MNAALALLLLPRQIGDELCEELTPALPQATQLIEDERSVGGLGRAEARLERTHHVLDALRRCLLLLDEILEAVDLVLQSGVCLLQLGAIAEQCKHARVLRRSTRGRLDDLEEGEVLQRFHERRDGPRRRLPAVGANAPNVARSDDLAPRSTPAICLTSCSATSADPVHAPRGRDARRTECELCRTAAPRRGVHHGRCARACRGSAALPDRRRADR